MAQTALVTGATSGIGEALCLLFASDDFDLVTVARDKEALEKQADELRRLDIDVLPIACDLSDPDAARTIFKRVQEAGKEIEILVNDAGYSPAGQFSDLPIADIRSMIQVSVTSLAELTSVFLHPMLERGHGRILNMSSMMAKTPCPYNALYGAAKVFVLSFSTALARELKHTGVSVTTVCPGATRTNFPKNAGIEDAPAWKYFSMDTDETAIRVYRALMRGERCAVTGWYNKVGSISVRLMPMGMQLLAGEWLRARASIRSTTREPKRARTRSIRTAGSRVKPGRRPADAAMRTITGPVTKTGILADARTIRLGGTTTISTASANTAAWAAPRLSAASAGIAGSSFQKRPGQACSGRFRFTAVARRSSLSRPDGNPTRRRKCA